MLSTIWQDVAYALRGFRRSPGFTAAAILTLAVGFGPPIAIFTLANWMVLRPIPGIGDSDSVSRYITGIPNPRGTTVGRISHLNFRDMTTRLRAVNLAATQGLTAAVAGNGQPERRMRAGAVSGSYFDVLRVQMQAGRPLTADDDNPSNPALAAVIGDSLWTTLFGRDPAAVGRTITVNGHQVTVVGIAERGFQGAQRFGIETLWLPGTTEALLRNLREGRSDIRATGGYYQFYARLRPGATWEQADTELALMTTWLVDTYPDDNARLKTFVFRNEGPINSYGRQRFLPLMALMFGASALVLIIASSNVASLVLMRGVGRAGEVAVRKAIGAGRWRVLRQQITETTLLWLLGGVAGVFAVWALIAGGITSRLALLGVPAIDLAFDAQPIAFGAALALIVGLAFSIGPAWKATRVDPALPLRAAATGTTRRFIVGPLLTIVQLSTSLALLVGALLLGLTIRNLLDVELGFEPDDVLVFSAQAAPSLSPEAAYTAVTDLEQRLATRPGVTAVALTDGGPFSGGGNSFSRIRATGQEDFIETRVTQVASPDFFSALNIALLHGRSFEEAETPAPGRGDAPVVLLSASLARQLFGTTDVVGRTVQIPVYQQPPRTNTIVGVAGDVRFTSLTDPPPLMMYSPRGLRGRFPTDPMVIVRTTGQPGQMADITTVSRSIAGIVSSGVQPLREGVAKARGEWDLLAFLVTALALIACVVAAVGVYGVVAFSVASRRAELGIRMALGATTAAVRAHVLRGTAIVCACGLFFGLSGAFLLAQALRTRLVGVSPMEPIVWTGASVLLVALVAIASFAPARQATRVNLAETLRAL